MGKFLAKHWPVLCSFLGIFALLAWGMSSQPVAYPAEDPIRHTLHDQWTQIIGDIRLPLENLQDFQAVPQGDSLVFERTLPDIQAGEVLLLYAHNQEVRVYVDGVCIQAFVMQEGYELLKTPGSAWNQIDLTQDMSGKTIRLELYSPLSTYCNVLYNLYRIQETDVNNIRLWDVGFSAMTTIVIFLLALLSYARGKIWKSVGRRPYFLAVGNLYLLISLWLSGSLGFFTFLTYRPIVSYLIRRLALNLIPLAVCQLLVCSRNSSRHPRIRQGLFWLSVANALLPWVLQFTLGISLLETRQFNEFTMLVFTLCYLYTLVVNLQQDGGVAPGELPYDLIGILLLGNGLDWLLYRTHPEWVPWTGVFSLAGILVYTLLTYLFFARQDAKLAQEKEELQVYYNKLQATSLMQQIKAHFIFNTLNAISTLCKRDARAADRAIKLFATYMRSYMYLVNQQDSIPFSQEMDLVRAYLSIEQMRFDDTLVIDIQTPVTDFLLPPLVLQPVIENAVVHGIRQKSLGGHITLTTQEEGGWVQIIVTDSGAGFNPETTRLGVGMSNLKRRIEMLADGTVTILSQPGHGTQVILALPKKTPNGATPKPL